MLKNSIYLVCGFLLLNGCAGGTRWAHNNYSDSQRMWRPKSQFLWDLQWGFVLRATKRATAKPHKNQLKYYFTTPTLSVQQRYLNDDEKWLETRAFSQVRWLALTLALRSLLLWAEWAELL